MNIRIWGIGKLGSVVSCMAAIFLKPKKIILKDVKDLTGDVMDLEQMIKGLSYNIKVTTKGNKADWDIICAGRARTKSVGMNDIYKKNKQIVNSILKNNNIKRCIIATNPSYTFYQYFKKKYKNIKFFESDLLLESWRPNRNDIGMEIIKKKGYTNLAPSLAIIKKIINEKR